MWLAKERIGDFGLAGLVISLAGSYENASNNDWRHMCNVQRPGDPNDACEFYVGHSEQCSDG
jgi:hypothetical protein